MKETKAFKTKDGRLFESQKDAETHEAERDKAARFVTDLVERIHYHDMDKESLEDKLLKAISLGLISIHEDRSFFLSQL